MVISLAQRPWHAARRSFRPRKLVVMILGDRDQDENMLTGRIAGVYTDGMRKIEIFAVRFMDGTIVKLDVPRIRFVDKDTDFEEGGYLTLEEF